MHRSLLAQKSLGNLIWNDKGSWSGKDGSCWGMPAPATVRHVISTANGAACHHPLTELTCDSRGLCQTFMVHASHTKPAGAASRCHCVRAEFLPTEHWTIAFATNAFQVHAIRIAPVPALTNALLSLPGYPQADDPNTQLSFEKDAYITITYKDESSPWCDSGPTDDQLPPFSHDHDHNVGPADRPGHTAFRWEGYLNSRPNRKALVPSNYVKIVPTKVCSALYEWPQPDEPANEKDLHFVPGQKIIAVRTADEWWVGFTAGDMGRLG